VLAQGTNTYRADDLAQIAIIVLIVDIRLAHCLKRHPSHSIPKHADAPDQFVHVVPERAIRSLLLDTQMFEGIRELLNNRHNLVDRVTIEWKQRWPDVEVLEGVDVLGRWLGDSVAALSRRNFAGELGIKKLSEDGQNLQTYVLLAASNPSQEIV
jgi:hypothetical protein